ncbi:hypothetical protein IWW36_002926, partial [Coemansia brasiliensis]
MQIQASPETPAVSEAPGSPAGSSSVSGGNVLTKDKLRQIVTAIQAMRTRGANEQNSEEYAKLMQIMRYVTAQQQQQQQQQQQGEAAETVAELQSKMPSQTNGGSASDTPTTPASAHMHQAPESTPKSATATVPEVDDTPSSAISSKATQFSSEDIAKLRKQIHAFRLVSKNMPLPPQLRQELWSSSISDEEKRL